MLESAHQNIANKNLGEKQLRRLPDFLSICIYKLQKVLRHLKFFVRMFFHSFDNDDDKSIEYYIYILFLCHE